VVPRERLSPLRKLVLACEILTVYASMRWRLRRCGIVEFAAAVHSGAFAPDSAETLRVAVRLAGAMNRTLRILPTDTRCLVRSQVLSALLSARGISSTFVIGARSQPDFAAHAWVEHQGRPLLPPRGFDGARLLEL
jgi:Transglutaminase-like superfamily